jgi:hypothetical protein
VRRRPPDGEAAEPARNEAADLYELDADDVFAHARRLNVDSSLGLVPLRRAPRLRPTAGERRGHRQGHGRL